MKKVLLLITTVFFALNLKAQTTKTDTTETKVVKSDSVSLDMLNAPSSPAFNLLGIAPSDIERPTDMNSFRISIQNATGNFSKLPSSYAVEFAPASLLKMKNQTLDKFNSTNFWDVVGQSATISFGLTQGSSLDSKTNDSVSFTKLGFGIKVSFIRPKWSSSTNSKLTQLEKAQSDFLTTINNEIANQSGRADLLSKIKVAIPKSQNWNDLIKQLAVLDSTIAVNETKKLQDSITYKDLSNAASKFKIERVGPFLDFASGIAIDFPTDKFDYSLVDKAGAWLTGGYEGGNNGFSILGIGRYLYQPDAIFDDPTGTLKTNNISTFDAGARVLYTTYNGKFDASTEAIYRSVLNKNTIPSSWRLVLNLEYSVAANQKLTFSFGRNFDGTLTKDGNLVSALNYIIGFGSSKQISSASQ